MGVGFKKNFKNCMMDFANISSLVNVSFPHEAIRGLGFFSAQVDAFPHHEWPKATSDDEMHQRVLRKSLTRELPHVEKAFPNRPLINWQL